MKQKFYKLNTESILNHNEIGNYYDKEKSFIMNNKELTFQCKKELKENNSKKIYVEINGIFYEIVKSIHDYEELGNYCNDCSFKNECWENYSCCMLEILFKEDTEYILKKETCTK